MLDTLPVGMGEAPAPSTVPPGRHRVVVAMTPRWWGGVKAIRRFLAAYLRPMLVSTEAVDRVALAAHELLENAVKYAAGPDSRVVCSASIEGDHVVVRVRNHAHPGHVRILVDEVAMVMAGDPLETYVAVMTRSLARDDQSQLGLARVRCEARAELAVTVYRRGVAVEARVALATA